MTEIYLGQILAFSFAFTPRGFLPCDGRLVPIAQNQALFSLLGTQYGGDGRTTFGLPDLRGRTPVGAGRSVDPGWNPSPYPMGERSGVESVTLLPTQLPAHTHGLDGCDTAAVSRSPRGALYATASKAIYADVGGAQVPLASSSLSAAGGTQPHSNLQPLLALNYCIATVGIFPSRN